MDRVIEGRSSYGSFRYNNVAASVAPDILRTGERLLAPTRRLTVDIPYVPARTFRLDLGKQQP